MKKLLLLLAITICISCSSDDDNGSGISKEEIKGSYELKEFEINGNSVGDYSCQATNSLVINTDYINMYLSFSTEEPCEAYSFRATDYVIEGNKIILNKVDRASLELFDDYDVTIINDNEIELVLNVANEFQLHYVFVR